MAVSTSQSTGTSSGTSSTTATIPAFSSALASTIAALAQSMEGWASSQYAYGKPITDSSVQQYMAAAGQAEGFANNLLGRYQSTFEPLMNNFVSQAESWASDARRIFNMGQAGSTANQADQAATETLKQNLESEGINTSSGAMVELLRKTAMDNARNVTQAETQAGLQTEQQGMQMEQIAAQMGQNVPGMWATAANTATSAINSAMQATLGFINTMVNANALPIQAYQAAATALKVGQVGTSQQGSQQQSTSQSFSPLPMPPMDNGSGSNRNSGNQRQPGQPSQTGSGMSGYNPMGSGGGSSTNQDNTGGKRGGGRSSAMGYNPYPAKIINVPDGSMPTTPTNTANPDQNQQWQNDPNLGVLPPATTDWSQNTMPTVDPTQMLTDPTTGVQSGGQSDQQLPPPMPNTNGGGVGAFGPNQPAVQQPTDQAPTDWGQVPTSGSFGAPPNPNGPGPNLPFAGDQSPSWLGDASQQAPSQSSDPWANMPTDPTSTDNMGQGNYGQGPQSWDNGASWGQDTTYTPPDLSGWTDPNAGGGGGAPAPYDPGTPAPYDPNAGGGYGGYKGGGGVLPTTGGHVPRHASPSGGKQTDDIPARLNADEYVIPKDVSHHLGSKYFDNLVAKSRKVRTGMAGPPTGGQRKAPLPNMQPRFTSHYMGG